MSDGLRWSPSAGIARTVLGGENFRDLDGGYWTFDLSAGRWLVDTGSGWQPAGPLPHFLEGLTGAPTAEARKAGAEPPPTSTTAHVAARVAAVGRAYRAGELTNGQAEGLLLALLVTDSAGRLWTVGPRSGTWFVLEGGQWRPRDGAPRDEELVADVEPSGLAADTPLLPERVTAPWNPPAPPQASARPPIAAGPTRRRHAGGGRRVLGKVMLVAGLASTAFGMYNGLNGRHSAGVAALSPTSTIAPVAATTAVTTVPATTLPPATAPVDEASTTMVTAVLKGEQPLVPVKITASSSLSPTPTHSYDPAYAIDGRDDTAWCVAGDGTGEWLAIELGGNPTVTRVGIVPGYNKTEGGDRWTENQRPTSVIWSFSSEALYDQTPDTDDRSLQFFELPSREQGSKIFLGIGGTTGTAGGDTCISEIAFVGFPG